MNNLWSLKSGSYSIMPLLGPHSPLKIVMIDRSSISATLLPEERQQVLYTALLRYSAEAKHLRDKALDYIVRTALLGTDESNSFRLGAIQKQLWVGPDFPQFRIEIIQETLNRLISEGKVGEVEVIKHRTYYLVRGQNDDLEPAYASAKEMFDRVLKRIGMCQ